MGVPLLRLAPTSSPNRSRRAGILEYSHSREQVRSLALPPHSIPLHVHQDWLPARMRQPSQAICDARICRWRNDNDRRPLWDARRLDLQNLWQGLIPGRIDDRQRLEQPPLLRFSKFGLDDFTLISIGDETD